MLSKPNFKLATHEAFADSIILNTCTRKHYSTRKKSCKANTHLIENNTCEDKKEYKYI